MKKFAAMLGSVALVVGCATAAVASTAAREDSHLDYPVRHLNHIANEEYGGSGSYYSLIRVFCHGPDLVYTFVSRDGGGISVTANDSRCQR